MVDARKLPTLNQTLLFIALRISISCHFEPEKVRLESSHCKGIRVDGQQCRHLLLEFKPIGDLIASAQQQINVFISSPPIFSSLKRQSTGQRREGKTLGTQARNSCWL